MIVINGLKLVRVMRDAGMPEKQAEALAEALDEGMRETVVTREFLSATIADVRTDMANMRAEIRTDMANLRTELRTDMANLKIEIGTDMGNIRTDMAKLSTTLTNKMYGIAVGIVVSTGLIQHFVK